MNEKTAPEGAVLEVFFVRSHNDLIPIGIQAGNNVSKSLRELIKINKPEITF